MRALHEGADTTEEKMSQALVDPYEPCPCGSGAKYKFCCRDKDRESKRVSSDPDHTNFSRRDFMKFVNNLGLTRHLGPEGAEEVCRLAQEMDENRRTQKTRRLTQLETQVDPRLPAVAVDLSDAYSKPDPVRMDGGLLRRGEPVTREWLARIKQDPAWQDGERPQELIEKTFLPLLDSWERHLTGRLRFAAGEVAGWRPLLENFLLGYLVAYEGKLAMDIDKKAHVLRQYLGNFYPRKFMDCDIESIYQALKGIASFYVHLHHLGLLDFNKAAGVVKVCEDHDFFRGRLEGYFRAEGEEMERWGSEWDYNATIIEES